MKKKGEFLYGIHPFFGTGVLFISYLIWHSLHFVGPFFISL